MRCQQEKKSSWKFQSDDRRWGVEKWYPHNSPSTSASTLSSPVPLRHLPTTGTLVRQLPFPADPSRFQDFTNASQCYSMCVCVCVALQPGQKLPSCKTALQIFKSHSITKMTWNADKPWNKRTQLDSSLHSTQLNRTELNREQDGVERTAWNSAPRDAFALLSGVQIQWHFLSSLLL